MGEVVAFRAKRLSGFLPQEPVDDSGDTIIHSSIPYEPPTPDTSPSEINPDSGDCA